MGHKAWWRRGLELLVLFSCHRAILGDGDVGCLFSESLCDPRTETCYDDLAFGRCMPQYVELGDTNLYQYNLDMDTLELLRMELRRLESEGYKWTHPLTQCIMQTYLYNIRYRRLYYDVQPCQRFKDYNSFDYEDKIRVPPIAIVKFTPNNGNFKNNFAADLYYQPGVQGRFVQQRPLYEDKPFQRPYNPTIGDTIDRPYEPRYSSLAYEGYQPITDGNSEAPNLPFPRDGYDEKLYRIRRDYGNGGFETVKNALAQEELARELMEQEALAKMQNLPEDELEFLVDESVPGDYALPSEIEEDPDREYEKTFSRKYKHQRQFAVPEYLESGEAWLDSVKRNLKEKEKNVDYESVDDNGEAVVVEEQLKEPGIFTEGGFVEPVEEKSENDALRNDYNSLLDASLAWRRELAGFKRRERLDVKKPGPLFSTNNYAFKTQSPPGNENDEGNEASQSDEEQLKPKNELNFSGYNSKRLMKNYNNVDLDYVYVEFKQPFHTWSEGEHVVKEVGKELGLVAGTLRDIRVGRAEVTFKVVPNNRNYNATDVANNIDNIRGKLRESLGVVVTRAGIGDKAKLPATLEVARDPDMNSSIFGAVAAGGITAAAAAAAVTLIIARRHAKSRAKLAGLATPDPEASKDYQDLCRARMAAKQPTEKPESPRITSLSRESDSNNAGSNRSSTSSWSDEPSLSNLDTTIGHVVLSYMEDHLKNRDKLDQEWAALCAYVADPSSTDNAEKEENVGMNRPGAPLPYDHSRVVLNHLANADDCDYINASTITDHDPRNPAYISTQGPLPNSTAEFWQMVWEQGSVVIVMLTRLTEDGVPMCHRYWPEQEYEQYHIYEVHLLSEYPGCDDYLVRSFYLKNLETGETRTVTQFHFLSWPENRVPHSTKALLEFRRKVNKSYRGRSCPIVVHCSDGAGRTGTYCLIDMVLNRMMKGAKEIDIAATFEHIRDQRANMVATKQQYEFVFVAVTEEVRANLKALPAPPAEKSPAASGNNPPSQPNK